MIGRAALLALLLVAARDDPLVGRTPGKPVDCIDLDFVQGPEIIDGRTILYRQNSRRVWRTQPVGTCTQLDSFSTLIVEIYGRQLCRNDQFRVITPGMSIASGVCRFDAFTPYDLAKGRSG